MRFIGRVRSLGRHDAPRDAWRHLVAAGSAARLAFPWRRRGAVRGEEEKGRKKEEERDELAA
jgi:hypothetical protein